jgi:hypothetical protein
MAWSRAGVSVGTTIGFTDGIGKLIPCILQLEIRCGLKKLEMILANGLSSHATQAEQVAYMWRVEKLMNTEVLGTLYSPSHWSFPCGFKGEKGNKKYKSGYLRITNSKVQWAMDGVNKIINVCLAGHDRRSEQNVHTECLVSYRFAMHVLVIPRPYMELELY